MAAREAKFLWKFFGALGISKSGFPRESDAVDLFSDSMGVVSISRNPVLSAATKHVEIADFFVREMVARGIVTVAYVSTSDMVADVLTKPLARIKFSRFISIILGTGTSGPENRNPLTVRSGNAGRFAFQASHVILPEHSDDGASVQSCKGHQGVGQGRRFESQTLPGVPMEHSKDGANAQETVGQPRITASGQGGRPTSQILHGILVGHSIKGAKSSAQHGHLYFLALILSAALNPIVFTT